MTPCFNGLQFFFDKTSSAFEQTGISPDNQNLAKELHKSIFRKFKKHQVLSSCRGNIRVTDLAGTQ